MDFKELLEVVKKSWPFDEKTYPELKNLDEKQRANFAVKHVLLHVQKSAGHIAKACEAADHGEELSLPTLDVHACKLVVNSVRLLGLLDVSAEGFYGFEELWLKDKPHAPPENS